MSWKRSLPDLFGAVSREKGFRYECEIVFRHSTSPADTQRESLAGGGIEKKAVGAGLRRNRASPEKRLRSFCGRPRVRRIRKDYVRHLPPARFIP